MRIGGRGSWAGVVAVLALGAVLAGCEVEKKGSAAADAGALDAGPPQPVVGGKLGQALAAAASGAPAGGVAPGKDEGDGPPANGVFSLQASAQALARDMPYRIEVVLEGSAPRSKLTTKFDPKAEQKLVLSVGLRGATQQALPKMDFELALKVDKPKKEAGKPAADDKGAADAASGGTPIVAKVAAATVASMGLGGPPKQLTDELAKLKGSTVRYQISPANVTSGFRIELAKGADPNLDTFLQAVAEAIGLVTAPLPEQPVGVGASWLVTDRSTAVAGTPVLRYRAYKIERVDAGGVALSLDIRQYAEDTELQLPGPSGTVTARLGEFASAGKAAITLDPAAFAPPAADVSLRLQAMLLAQGQAQGQRMMAQSELTAKLGPVAAPPP